MHLAIAFRVPSSSCRGDARVESDRGGEKHPGLATAAVRRLRLHIPIRICGAESAGQSATLFPGCAGRYLGALL